MVPTAVSSNGRLTTKLDRGWGRVQGQVIHICPVPSMLPEKKHVYHPSIRLGQLLDWSGSDTDEHQLTYICRYYGCSTTLSDTPLGSPNVFHLPIPYQPSSHKRLPGLHWSICHRRPTPLRPRLLPPLRSYHTMCGYVLAMHACLAMIHISSLTTSHPSHIMVI